MTDASHPRRESASQTAGPYVHIGCTPNFAGLDLYGGDLGAVMITGPVAGQTITITGRVLDGDGVPMTDAMVEIWQADAAGRFPTAQSDPHFTGWGRCACDQDTGEFRFETLKPGAVPWPDGRMQAPHITVWIVARGINIGLHTRLYFADEADANNADPILSQITDRARVGTLLAGQDDTGAYRFDVRVQGPGETVFFDI